MLIEKITEHEFNIMEDVFNYGEITKHEPFDYILREWNSEKEVLYKIFKENLILEKEINIKKEEEFMIEDIEKMWRGGKGSDFLSNYKRACYDDIFNLNNKCEGFNLESMKRRRDLVQLISDDCLISNRYDGETFEIILPNEKRFKIQNGCKVSRVLGKLATAFNIEGYEEFRIAHSQILNENGFSGTLCLSIHPLDYMTMSDNSNGWRSCMSWDAGEYRMGTVEMMNSSMVVVAYLKSSEEKFYDWNSKRWRELFIVDKHLLFGIKGYPYWNRTLESICLEWLAELVNDYYDSARFENIEKVNFSGDNGRYYSTESKDGYLYTVEFEFDTNYMYNDIYSKHCFMLNRNDIDSITEDTDEKYYYNYSGQEECMSCGSFNEIYGEDTICCDNCDPGLYCSDCGERISEDEAYWVDGEVFCEYCYDNLPACENCGARTTGDVEYRVKIMVDENHYATSPSIPLCEYCLTINGFYDSIDLKFIDGEYLIPFESLTGYAKRTYFGATTVAEFINYFNPTLRTIF